MDELDSVRCHFFRRHCSHPGGDDRLRNRFTLYRAKGFLPIATTRGDRLFIGLLSAAYIHLTFLAVSDITLLVALAVSVLWLLVLLRWG